MIVLGDIEELWDMRQEGVWRTCGDDSVTVMDCSSVVMSLDSLKAGRFGGKAELRKAVPQVDDLPREWNHRDKLTEETKLLHFTNMKTQPWKPYPEVIKYQEHPDKGAVELWRTFAESAS